MKLGDREGVLLGNCLENNTALRQLDLSSNDLGEKTAHALGQVGRERGLTITCRQEPVN